MDIATLKHQVKLANESPLEDLPRDRDDRKELAAALSKLRSKFESPVDRIIQFLFQVNKSQHWLQVVIDVTKVQI